MLRIPVLTIFLADRAVLLPCKAPDIFDVCEALCIVQAVSPGIEYYLENQVCPGGAPLVKARSGMQFGEVLMKVMAAGRGR